MVRRDLHERDTARRLVEHATTAAVSSRVLVHHASALQRSRFQYYDGEYQYYYPYYDYPPEEAKFIGIIPWALKILRIFAIGLMLLASSTICYGIFYWAVMPGNYASRPLFFDYTGTAEYTHHDVVTLDPTVPAVPQKTKKSKRIWNKHVATISATPTTPDSCTYTPWATVDLFAREQAVTWGDTLHPDLMPPQETKDRILQPKQGYYVEVYLTLPESSVNRQTGMFGVAVDLLSQPSGDNDDTKIKLASSVRSARLPHESGWLAVARKLAWIFPITFFGMEESQTVVVPSFRHIVESKEYPLRHAVVRLVSQASYLHSPQTQQPKPPVEVIGGEIRIGKELNPWQQLLKDRYYLCYLCGTLMLFGAHVGAWILIRCYLSETEDYGESYFDASFDANDDENMEGSNNNDSDNGSNDDDDNDDEDFESLNGDDGSGQRSSPGLQGDRQPGGMGANTGQDTNNVQYPFSQDEDSQDWEEVTPEEDDNADDIVVEEERQSQPGTMHAGHNSILRTREQRIRDNIDEIAKRRVAQERGAAERLPSDKHQLTDPSGRIMHNNQCRQTALSHEEHRPKVRIPDISSSLVSSQAKVPGTDNFSYPSCKAAAEKSGPDKGGNNTMELFFDCTQDSAEDAACLKNDERPSELRKRLSKDSPSLLAASGMGCSGSTTSTSSPLHDKRNKIDLNESISSAKPPLPEVNFLSNRSFELSPIALTPARILSAQTTAGPLSKVVGENEECDGAATRSSTCKRQHTATRLAQEHMLKPKPASSGKKREVTTADIMSSALFLDTKRRLEITPDDVLPEDPGSDSSTGAKFCCEFPPARAVDLHGPSPRADSQSEESEKAIVVGIPTAPSSTDSQSEGSYVEDGLETVANQVVGAPIVSIFDLPEAQMLDSFLHDLINPFVR